MIATKKDKTEADPTKPMSVSSYLRKRYNSIMSKKQEMEKDDITGIKSKYTEKKPLTFKEYAEKIKAKYAEPKSISDEEKISQIKEKHRQQEQGKIDAPEKENLALVNKKRNLAMSEDEES